MRIMLFNAVFDNYGQNEAASSADRIWCYRRTRNVFVVVFGDPGWRKQLRRTSFQPNLFRSSISKNVESF